MTNTRASDLERRQGLALHRARETFEQARRDALDVWSCCEAHLSGEQLGEVADVLAELERTIARGIGDAERALERARQEMEARTEAA